MEALIRRTRWLAVAAGGLAAVCTLAVPAAAQAAADGSGTCPSWSSSGGSRAGSEIAVVVAIVAALVVIGVVVAGVLIVRRRSRKGAPDDDGPVSAADAHTNL